MVLDFETLRNVDAAVQNTNHVDRNVSVSSNTLRTTDVDPGVWPQSILYIEFFVGCHDQLDNGLTFRLQCPETGNEVLAMATGTDSSEGSTAGRLEGDITIPGHALGESDDAPLTLQYGLFNRGASSKNFSVTVNVWFLREGKAYASGQGDLSGHGQSVESFDA